MIQYGAGAHRDVPPCAQRLCRGMSMGDKHMPQFYTKQCSHVQWVQGLGSARGRHMLAREAGCNGVRMHSPYTRTPGRQRCRGAQPTLRCLPWHY